MANSSKRTYATPRTAAPRAPAPVAGTADLCLRRRCSDTQRQVWSVSVGPPGAHKVLFEPSKLSVSGGYGVCF